MCGRCQWERKPLCGLIRGGISNANGSAWVVMGSVIVLDNYFYGRQCCNLSQYFLMYPEMVFGDKHL